MIMTILSFFHRFLDLPLWAQGMLIIGLPIFIIQFLRAIPAFNDWWELGFPDKLRRKLNMTKWQIINFFNSLWDRGGIKVPRIKSPRSTEKVVFQLIKLLIGLFLVYRIAPDIASYQTRLNLVRSETYAPGIITHLDPFEDYIDNEFGQGGAFVEYKYSFTYNTPMGKEFSLTGLSQNYPGYDLDERELPFKVMVRYDKENPSIADVPEISGLELMTIVPGLLFSFALLIAALYLIIHGIYKLFKND